MKKYRNTEPSMLKDIRDGKPCDYLAFNGVVCEYGRKAGLKTPVNDRIVRIIHDIEEGNLIPQMSNAAMFSDLI